jgi:glycosyltransferase involved in cell wall biosynthesis
VLAPTPSIVSEIKKLRGDERVSLWSRGIDGELFNPSRRDPHWRRAQGWRDEDVIVLFFGRLVLEKGVADFIATIRRLQARGIKVKPLVVGAGPAESLFAQLPDAMLTGHLDGPDLARAVTSADILIHPSRTEAFGNVVLEAMASGLPVVAATADSSTILIQDGRTGTLVADGNVDRFVAEVEKLAGDPDRRRKLGEEASAASKAFSWDVASQSVLDAYQELVECKRL